MVGVVGVGLLDIVEPGTKVLRIFDDLGRESRYLGQHDPKLLILGAAFSDGIHESRAMLARFNQQMEILHVGVQRLQLAKFHVMRCAECVP